MTTVAHDMTSDVPDVTRIPLGKLREDADRLAPGELERIVARLRGEPDTSEPRAMFNSSP
jgi:hypothetical protein